MIPTVAQVKTQYLSIFNNAVSVYTDEVFTNGLQQALDALFQAQLIGQVPSIRKIVTVTVNAGTTSLTPADAGIADFADYVHLRERLNGSTDKFRQLEAREDLTQRTQTDALLEFVWRLDTFYFIGATTRRDLEITYESSGSVPASGPIGVDGCLSFLANYAAGVTGGRKGEDETAQRCMNFAVGPKYDQGTMGGELFRLVQAKVRSEQKTQIAPRPFTTQRRGTPLWRAPFIGPAPGGIGTAPAQLSSTNGTITGVMDGVNPTFFMAYPVATALISRNGSLMTIGADCIFGANVITFLPGQIPIAGDTITAEVWI